MNMNDAATRMPQITEQFHSLEKEQENTSELLAALADRLQNGMSQPPLSDQAKEANVPDSQLCPAAERLRHASRLASNHNAILLGLLQRIEL